MCKIQAKALNVMYICKRSCIRRELLIGSKLITNNIVNNYDVSTADFWKRFKVLLKHILTVKKYTMFLCCTFVTNWGENLTYYCV